MPRPFPALLSDTVPALPDTDSRKTERGPITPTKPYFIIRRGGDSDGQITPIFLETGSAAARHSPHSPRLLSLLLTGLLTD